MILAIPVLVVLFATRGEPCAIKSTNDERDFLWMGVVVESIVSVIVLFFLRYGHIYTTRSTSRLRECLLYVPAFGAVFGIVFHAAIYSMIGFDMWIGDSEKFDCFHTSHTVWTCLRVVGVIGFVEIGLMFCGYVISQSWNRRTVPAEVNGVSAEPLLNVLNEQ